MNIIWLDDYFKQHQVCIEFVEINDSHSEENLVFIVYSTLTKFNICQKLLIQAYINKSQNILIKQSYNNITNFNFLLSQVWLHNFKLLFLESLNYLNEYRNKIRKQRKLLIIILTFDETQLSTWYKISLTVKQLSVIHVMRILSLRR